MTWILVIVAYSVGGAPDERIDPPRYVPAIQSLTQCHKAARDLASVLSRTTAATVSLVYDCIVEEGTNS